MGMNNKTTGVLFFSITILMLTFASIYNWFQGLGGSGAHAEVYDELFTLYWSVGTVIGIAVYAYFLYLVYTSWGKDSGEEMTIGQSPVVRGSNKGAIIVSFTIALFLLVLSDTTFDSIDFFEQHEEHTTDNSFTIAVTGYQYYWDYEYPNGIHLTSVGEEPLKIPVDVPVVFEVTSGDVFHSFALPEHRIKIDSIPGRSNEGWILADEVGTFPIMCAELCGDEHAIMGGEIEVMSTEDFDAWYNSGVSA